MRAATQNTTVLSTRLTVRMLPVSSIRSWHLLRKKGPDPFSSVPAPAQRPDERHRRLVARRAHLQRLAAVAQLASLRVEELELAHVACAVARIGKRSGAARRGDGAPLRLGLLGEQAQRGELVLDLLECDQHLVAILGDGAVELSPRRLDAGLAPAAVEDRQRGEQADAPGARGPLEEIGKLGGGITPASR